MATISFQGPNRMIVRRKASLAADPDWADPAVAISEAEFETSFFGVSPHRGGGLGALRQLGLDVVFLTADGVEVGGVTFSWQVLDIITRSEINAIKGAAGRHFVRKLGAGVAFKCEERLTADVNGTQSLALRLFAIVDGSGLATNYIVVATEIDYR